MTKKEAEKILQIMKTADGGCIYRVRDLFRLFVKEFPEFSNLAEKIFFEEFEEELEKIKAQSILKSKKWEESQGKVTIPWRSG
jgi:hypothetical protein